MINRGVDALKKYETATALIEQTSVMVWSSWGVNWPLTYFQNDEDYIQVFRPGLHILYQK